MPGHAIRAQRALRPFRRIDHSVPTSLHVSRPDVNGFRFGHEPSTLGQLTEKGILPKRSHLRVNAV